MIRVNFYDAVKVRFKKPILVEDFVEKGMTAWLTDIEWDAELESYVLYFDFSDFEVENAKYFKLAYKTQTGEACTAKEVGQYNPKYSVYFSIPGCCRDDVAFETAIQDYLIG